MTRPPAVATVRTCRVTRRSRAAHAPGGFPAGVSARPAAGFDYASSPGALPEEVRMRFLEALADGGAQSPLRLYHRAASFRSLAERLEEKLRRALEVPAEYHVLFLQGGASAQFAMVPLNLCGRQPAAYLHTGYWSGRALAEAGRIGCRARRAADGRALRFHAIPPSGAWRLDTEAAYLYYADNETADGLEFHCPPAADVPLVADMSSSLWTKRIEVHRHGLIFSGTQKNLGLPGLTVVLLHPGLLRDVPAGTPSLYDYRVHLRHRSLYNTPVTLAWYLAELMLDWLGEQGGTAVMEARNRRKAEVVYAALDAGGLYRCPVASACRSRVSVVFDLRVPELCSVFLEEARREGLHGLAGHRSRGGLRAALYNAMPEAGARALAAFLAEFERRRG